MKESEDASKKIQELQLLERNLQIFISQRQPIQIELNETNNALKELENTDGEVYRIISGIMIKSSKDETIKELAEKKKILDMRINSMEKQEKILEEKSLRLREEVAKEFVRKAEKK